MSMKRIRTQQSIMSMAIINPQLCKSSSIQVELEQKDEGQIPHLHVYLDKTCNSSNCAYVRLDCARYADHHTHRGKRSDSKKLSGKQKDEFINIMNSIWSKWRVVSKSNPEKSRVATGYEIAVNIWIDTYGDTVAFEWDEDGYPIMPDYTEL